MQHRRKAWRTKKYDMRMLGILRKAKNSGVTIPELARKCEIPAPALLPMLLGKRQASPEFFRLLELVLDTSSVEGINHDNGREVLKSGESGELKNESGIDPK